MIAGRVRDGLGALADELFELLEVGDVLLDGRALGGERFDFGARARREISSTLSATAVSSPTRLSISARRARAALMRSAMFIRGFPCCCDCAMRCRRGGACGRERSAKCRAPRPRKTTRALRRERDRTASAFGFAGTATSDASSNSVLVKRMPPCGLSASSGSAFTTPKPIEAARKIFCSMRERSSSIKREVPRAASFKSASSDSPSRRMFSHVPIGNALLMREERDRILAERREVDPACTTTSPMRSTSSVESTNVKRRARRLRARFGDDVHRAPVVRGLTGR